MPRAHIIGAGLAGLSSALRLAEAGYAVTVHEAAGQAGGRCRSFFDETLGCLIDNGNHLLLSGNRSAMAYLDLVGARDTLAGPADASFPFLDLATGERWTVRPNKGPVPWWIFAPRRRIAGTRASDYLSGLKLLFAREDQTIAQCLPATGPLFQRFWDPLTVAVLNAPADVAAARLMVPVLLETFARGAEACRPLIARHGLSESLVTPALVKLARHGADVRFGTRLVGLDEDGARVRALVFNRGQEAVSPDDVVVLALPPTGVASVLPDCPAPVGAYPIVNVHYRLERPATNSDTPELLGLVNGVAHWLFLRETIASVTVSAAEDLAQLDANEVGRRVWRDVAQACGLEGPPPPHRVVKERRATFAQTPAELARRSGPRTRLKNVVLAGDWTRTGLPATIEGAIRSGERAAEVAARGSREHPGTDHPSHRLSQEHSEHVADEKRTSMTRAAGRA